MKSIIHGVGEFRLKERNFLYAQENLKKDIKRALGVLVMRFYIVKHSFQVWNREHMFAVMETCKIIHNMIVQSRRDCPSSGMSGVQHCEQAQ